MLPICTCSYPQGSRPAGHLGQHRARPGAVPGCHQERRLAGAGKPAGRHLSLLPDRPGPQRLAVVFQPQPCRWLRQPRLPLPGLGRPETRSRDGNPLPGGHPDWKPGRYSARGRCASSPRRSLIAAEDTRHTVKLLNHFDIHTPMTSYFEHNKLSKVEQILAALEKGDVALVSDAGTPALNDPGYELVRQALAGRSPGQPGAGTLRPGGGPGGFWLADRCLSLPGLPAEEAQRPAPKTGLRQHTIPLRCSSWKRRTACSRPPWRIFSQCWEIERSPWRASSPSSTRRSSGVRSALPRRIFTTHPPRGEFTLVIAGKTPETGRWSEEALDTALLAALEAGQPPTHIASHLAAEIRPVEAGDLPAHLAAAKIKRIQRKGRLWT